MRTVTIQQVASCGISWPAENPAWRAKLQTVQPHRKRGPFPVCRTGCEVEGYNAAVRHFFPPQTISQVPRTCQGMSALAEANKQPGKISEPARYR